MEDIGIITLYFNRDERAIVETEEKYGKLCKKIANNILGDEYEADECVNDTYLGLWNAIPPERPNSLKAFAARIARNVSLKKLKYNTASKRACDTVISIHELEEILPDSLNNDSIEDMELGEWINEFLKNEKEDRRNVFIRKYWFFDSVSEICEMYGYTESKVKSMLYHTRTKLHHYLTKKGVSI